MLDQTQPGLRVQMAGDRTPAFPQRMVVEWSTLTPLARELLRTGQVEGRLEGRMGTAVVFSRAALMLFYERLARVAWDLGGRWSLSERQDAQDEVAQLLNMVGRVPDFAIHPDIEANPIVGNPAPPPPTTDESDEWLWILRTYAPGTVVKALKPMSTFRSADQKVPVGFKGVIESLDQRSGIRIRWYNAPYSHYDSMETLLVFPVPQNVQGAAQYAPVRAQALLRLLEPLDDHWPAAPPPRRLWKGRHTAPNRRTSRRTSRRPR